MIRKREPPGARSKPDEPPGSHKADDPSLYQRITPITKIPQLFFRVSPP